MKAIGPVNAMYPMPTTLVGATVNDKPNFLAVAHVGIFNHGIPQYISIGLDKDRYTSIGIREHKTFSICLPSEDLVAQTDYCGIMTGKHTDKSALFEVFYGQLETAPMIRQCPVNMELKLHDVLDYDTHEVFVGELVQTHVDENVLTEESIDLSKVRPLIFDLSLRKYWSLGPSVANAWSIGKTLK